MTYNALFEIQSRNAVDHLYHRGMLSLIDGIITGGDSAYDYRGSYQGETADILSGSFQVFEKPILVSPVAYSVFDSGDFRQTFEIACEFSGENSPEILLIIRCERGDHTKMLKAAFVRTLY